MKMTAITCSALALTCSALAAEPADAPPEQEEAWLDSSHKYVVHHADNLAEWVDNFFGNATTEEEAPYSTLRLRYEMEWDEEEGLENDIKLRGKVHLPQLNKRLSLLFSDDDDQTGSDDLLIDKQDSPDNVALQYTARERDYDRVDFKVGLRSSGKPKASVRYRYQRPFLEDYIGRFSQEVRYRGGDGLDARTRLDIDYIIDDNRVVRWFNKADWEETESGMEWSSGVSLTRRISQQKAITYYVSGQGETQYGHVHSYGVGMRYRQNLFRPWFFAEVQPSYSWREDHEIDRDRQGVAGLLVRFEMVFERARKE